MPDDDVAKTTDSAAAAPAAATPDESKARLEAIEKRIGALADTVTAALQPRTTTPAPGGAVDAHGIPANFRAALKQHGATDADIDANAGIILPYLKALLQTDGAVILGGIQEVRDDVEMVKASRSKKKYPYFSELEDTIGTLRDEARKNGRYLSVHDAYQAAVAVDVASSESRIDAARAKSKHDSHSADADAQNLGANHGAGRGASRTVVRTAASTEDVANMSREDRKKWFAEHADLPIR